MKRLSFAFFSEFSSEVASTRSRMLKVMEYCQEKGYRVSFNTNLDKSDVVVFQKGLNKAGALGKLRGLFNRAILKRKFIVFDIDDWYDTIYDYYISHADLVFVGSDFLKKQWQHLNQNIVSLDDPLDVKKLDAKLPKYNLKDPRIGWFGNTSNLPVLRSKNIEGVKTITAGGDIEWRRDTVDEEIQKFDLIVLPQEKNVFGSSKGNCRMLKTI